MRKRISPATVISCVALFFSLGGASLAASHYLITSVHQIAPKVQRELRGSHSPAGPQGAPGAVGAVGPPGALTYQYVPGTDTSVPAGESVSVVVDCPVGAGVAPVDGGFIGLPALSAYNSHPILPATNPQISGGWVVSVENSGSAPETFHPWVICAKS